jgi:hypothetical protein
VHTTELGLLLKYPALHTGQSYSVVVGVGVASRIAADTIILGYAAKATSERVVPVKVKPVANEHEIAPVVFSE